MKQTFFKRIYQYFITESIRIVKESGLKGLIRQRGIKFFVVIFFYYLIRDTLLYVLIPLYVALGC